MGGNDKVAASDTPKSPCTVDVSMHVTVPKGCTCRMFATLDVPIDADQVYDILTDPENRRVFRNVKQVLHRSVVEDDGNKQVVDVEQLGRWKFLCFGGSFTTKLRVTQDRRRKTVKYALQSGGFMRTFDGTWKILEKKLGSEKEDLTDWKAVDEPAVRCSPTGAHVHFAQELCLAVSPPASLSRIIGKITAHTAKNILRDLYEESLRIYHGIPVQEEVQRIQRPLVWKRRSPRTRRSRLREQKRVLDDANMPA
mmetsp:Transcript_5855/g.36300  ORF Transcript_5855/g.36300 Transcript_5855/m.36300 type:complete len:253 (-) Transcript_5855:460-1218(-)